MERRKVVLSVCLDIDLIHSLFGILETPFVAWLVFYQLASSSKFSRERERKAKGPSFRLKRHGQYIREGEKRHLSRSSKEGTKRKRKASLLYHRFVLKVEFLISVAQQSLSGSEWMNMCVGVREENWPWKKFPCVSFLFLFTFKVCFAASRKSSLHDVP